MAVCRGRILLLGKFTVARNAINYRGDFFFLVSTENPAEPKFTPLPLRKLRLNSSPITPNIFILPPPPPRYFLKEHHKIFLIFLTRQLIFDLLKEFLYFNRLRL
jgi:hypothetical protein